MGRESIAYCEIRWRAGEEEEGGGVFAAGAEHLTVWELRRPKGMLSSPGVTACRPNHGWEVTIVSED